MKRAWCFIFLAACAQRPNQGAQSVSGRVVLGSGATDFSRVLLALDDGIPQHAATLGDFNFTGVLPGTHLVTARCECDTLEERVAMPVVVGDAAVSGVALLLTPMGRVHGVVADNGGVAVAGARVFAAGTAAVAYSQKNGAYILERVPLGTRTLAASAQGFVTELRPRVVIAADVSVDFNLPIDTTPDPNAQNQIPAISAFSFAPSPIAGLNPQPIPVASASTPDVVHAGAPLTVTVTAADPEGGVLTYLWSADKGQIIGSGTSDASVEWVPSDEGGEVVVVVVDPQGAAATARHAFHAPPKSMRGATVHGDEVIYSEGREDTRDVVGFDLVARSERTLAGGAKEQNSPRVVGDTLAFGDQVFTLVNPTVFQMRLLGLGSATLASVFGRDLAPDDSIAIDFRLDTPLTGSAVTEISFEDVLAPFGIGTFDVPTQSFRTFESWNTSSDDPNYPCFVSLGATALGVVGSELRAYVQGAPFVHAADLPVDNCIEMQADGAWVAIRQGQPGGALSLVNWKSGEIRSIGTQVYSFALHGSRLAYSDTRTGFSGVYLYDVAADHNAVVPVRGAKQRRVLELSDKWLVYGELAETADPQSYSATSLWAYALP